MFGLYNGIFDMNYLSKSEIEETSKKIQDIIKQIEDDYSIEKTRWSMDDVPR